VKRLTPQKVHRATHYFSKNRSSSRRTILRSTEQWWC